MESVAVTDVVLDSDNVALIENELLIVLLAVDETVCVRGAVNDQLLLDDGTSVAVWLIDDDGDGVTSSDKEPETDVDHEHERESDRETEPDTETEPVWNTVTVCVLLADTACDGDSVNVVDHDDDSSCVNVPLSDRVLVCDTLELLEMLPVLDALIAAEDDVDKDADSDAEPDKDAVTVPEVVDVCADDERVCDRCFVAADGEKVLLACVDDLDLVIGHRVWPVTMHLPSGHHVHAVLDWHVGLVVPVHVVWEATGQVESKSVDLRHCIVALHH